MSEDKGFTSVYYEVFDDEDVYETQHLPILENETIKSFGLRVVEAGQYDASGGVVVYPSAKNSKAFVPGNFVASKFPDGATEETCFRVKLKTLQQQNGELRCCFRIHFCIHGVASYT
jgi:hypothetical protein